GMISGMVQAFFGWRVKVLTGSWILFIIIQLCSVAVFLKSFADFHKFEIIVIIWLICAILADIIITTTLVTYLKKYKTGFNKHTDSHLDRIIRCKFSSPPVFATADAKPSFSSDHSDWSYYHHLCDGRSTIVPIVPFWNICYSAHGHPNGPMHADDIRRHFIFNCVLPKLYTNSLLSSLNSRGGWKLSKSKNTLVEHSQSDISFRS
ncbi:hypothetical protein Moror_16586, partial [Moniliophthora roreri MCA 2997]